MRNTMSLPAPAGNPLMIVIGLAGHGCAPAAVATTESKTAAQKRSTQAELVVDIEQNLSRLWLRTVAQRLEPSRSAARSTNIAQTRRARTTTNRWPFVRGRQLSAMLA